MADACIDGNVSPDMQTQHSSLAADASNLLSHSSSSPQLAAMASLPSPLVSPGQPRTNITVLNAITDLRTPSPSSISSRADSVVSQHPDLSDEMASLSTKLVKAINHQTNLDDELQATRHELEVARDKVAELEVAAQVQNELAASEKQALRDHADNEAAQLRKEMEEEKDKRQQLESEINDLTASVFTEANNMVVTARQQAEAADKRAEQFKTQLSDAETLLQSQQEQLQDLKAVLERLSSEQDEEESAARVSTAPSTPGLPPQERINRIYDSANVVPITPGVDDVPPDQPLKFSHLIHPVLRTDLLAYKEFADLMKSVRSNSNAAPSRISSGSFGSLNVVNLAATSSHQPRVISPSAPNFTQNAGALSQPPAMSGVPSLKDTKVYKRALAEELEPTLRLDIAPGLSWLARRAVLNSMTAGSFSIEPMPPAPLKFRGPVNSCSLCGENRKGDAYARKHRFRTTETEDASRYPLCDYCLGRVRSSCDYISFLRMIRDGHWRADTEDEIKAAWEESTRFREKMFWQRIGGGVVPSFAQRDSPRSPTFSKTDDAEHGLGHTPSKPDDSRKDDLPNGQRASSDLEDLSRTELFLGSEKSEPCSGDPEQSSDYSNTNPTSPERDNSVPPEDDSLFTTPMATPPIGTKHLSVLIPGSFD